MLSKLSRRAAVLAVPRKLNKRVLVGLWAISGFIFSAAAHAGPYHFDPRCGTQVVVEQTGSALTNFYLPNFPGTFTNPNPLGGDLLHYETRLLPNLLNPAGQVFSDLNLSPSSSTSAVFIGLLLPVDADFGTVDFQLVVEVTKFDGGPCCY